MHVDGNIFDQGARQQIVLQPAGSGIDGLELDNNYISTPNQPANGVCLDQDNSLGGSIVNISVAGNYFAYCGRATAFAAPADHIIIADNNIGYSNIGLAVTGASRVLIHGNSCRACKISFSVADGKTGSDIVFGPNNWDQNSAYSLTQTNAGNFTFLEGNTGKVLAGRWAATSTSISSPGSCVLVAVPHTLGAAPNLDKSVGSASLASGGLQGISAYFVSANASHFIVQVCAATIVAAGTVRVTVQGGV